MNLKSPLQAIRYYCLECQGWNETGRKPLKGVRWCSNEKCKLHPFRFGRNENRKGIGGNPDVKSDVVMEYIRDLI